MPMTDDELKQAINDGNKPLAERFKWLNDYKHLIETG